jgi:hypothetical protein
MAVPSKAANIKFRIKPVTLEAMVPAAITEEALNN